MESFRGLAMLAAMPGRKPQTIVCEHLHQPSGWLSPGTLHVDGDGMIVRVIDGAIDGAPDEETIDGASMRLNGWVIPGMANVHSHAFQRALVGLAEHGDPGRDDSFWTWRTEMYRLALEISPEDVEAIAAQLYVEMLEAGMTAVGEFHYLHHDRDGSPYADRAEMSHRIAAAAERAGIGLTHLPVLYMTGGFTAVPSDQQRRFVHRSLREFIDLVDGIALEPQANGMTRLGIAPHSLRAVPDSALIAAVREIRSRDSRAPIHIHIAEQQREVDEALAYLGARPVAWLLRQEALAGLDDRFCLVHATHLDRDEVRDLATSDAIVGLCPTTEANLGDGIFPAVEFLAGGGRIAVGSDSHVTVSVAEELRTLEYGQRLKHQRRNLLVGNAEHGRRHHHVGRHLYDQAATWGAAALDQPLGALVPGRRADLVALDSNHPRLVGHGPDTVLDAWIFGAARGAVRDVLVAGRPRVRDGQHVDHEEIAESYRRCIVRLRRS